MSKFPNPQISQPYKSIGLTILKPNSENTLSEDARFEFSIELLRSAKK
jgi:hypothetical protein